MFVGHEFSVLFLVLFLFLFLFLLFVLLVLVFLRKQGINFILLDNFMPQRQIADEYTLFFSKNDTNDVHV